MLPVFNQAFKQAVASQVPSILSGNAQVAIDYILDTYHDCRFDIMKDFTGKLIQAKINVTTNSGDMFLVAVYGYGSIHIVHCGVDHECNAD